ncbi:MAG: HDIG domain-containing protein [Eubacteriales bacterium]|nr:HDIG domain-containing protein [Eubacteriales bacterium]
MNMSTRSKKYINGLLIVLTLIAIVVVVFFGSIPRTYDLEVGDTSMYDITAPRGIVDEAETERRAREAMTLVPTVMMRSEEKSAASLSAVTLFRTMVDERRAELYPTERVNGSENEGETGEGPTRVPTRKPSESTIQLAASSLISGLDQNLNIVIPSGDAEELMRMDRDRLDSIFDIMDTEANALVLKSLDALTLQRELSESSERISEQLTFNSSDTDMVVRFISLLIQPNIEYNVEATENAKQAAYDQVLNNPVMVNRGSRIITAGEIVTEDVMAKLEALDLIDNDEIDWITVVGTVGLVLITVVLAWLFFSRYNREIFEEPRHIIAVIITVLITLILSAYISSSYPLAPPIYFAAVVITAYFGFRSALVVSFLLALLVSPMVGFAPAFPLIAMSGSLVAALNTRGISRQDNYAKIILATAGINFLLTVVIGLLEKETWAIISTNVVQTVLSGVLSVIVAIGIMPLYEMIFNTVSPLRLIELSQPGHPLLKRLFLEAPGTSQHSLMVANLADAAAEAIGANSMIARTGAYYHDIGKLEAPMYFTENQQGENPHDHLPPEKSSQIITQHPNDSLKIGRRYRLPLPILRIANEHHGTTRLRYFYHKAKEEADKNGKEHIDDKPYRYTTPIPSTPESAVVMLADSTEAAMRSSGIENIADAEKLIRNVFKEKIEQEQLKDSGLSFADVETIIDAFLQVYAGHFHERVKYPEATAETT